MNIQQHMELKTRLEQTRRDLGVALLSVTQSSNQYFHTRAIKKIQAMCDQLAAIIKAQHQFDDATTDEARAAAAEELVEATLRFELEEYHAEPVHLGDHIVIDNFSNEYRIAPYGRWFSLNDNLPMPETVRIEDRELKHLYKILDALRDDTGIDFTAMTVQFTPVSSD